MDERDGPARVLVVDDTPHNLRLMEAMLAPRGYEVVTASDGETALDLIERERPDIVLLDVVMPGMDGFEVCKKIRADVEGFLPVVMVTGSVDRERAGALDAGADDLLPKPVNQTELLARVRSLVRLKRYHDTVTRQAEELAELNRTLEARVEQQVGELQRLGRLRRFLSPQIADLIVSSGNEASLENHRREIAVLFCDLRGFTAFAGSAEPEEVMSVLRQFHDVLGGLVAEHQATVGFFCGDGLMVFFNDPIPCEDPAWRAVHMALSLHDRLRGPLEDWRRRGYELGVGAGIGLGYATLGQVGFEGRRDYGAIGTVVNLASRLCDEARDGEVIVGQRAYAEVEHRVKGEELPELHLKGFDRPVSAWRIVAERSP